MVTFPPLTVAILAVVLIDTGTFTQGHQQVRMSLEDHILKETVAEPIDCGTHPRAKADADALHRSPTHCIRAECLCDAVAEHNHDITRLERHCLLFEGRVAKGAQNQAATLEPSCPT